MGHESYQRQEEIRGSSDRALGLVFAAVFALIGVVPWFTQGAALWWSVWAAAGFAAVALAAPRVLAPLNWFWTRLGLVLHKVVSPIVLGIMFFLVITPMGVVMRLLGKDPLRLRFDKTLLSYWLERDPPGPKSDSFPNQF